MYIKRIFLFFYTLNQFFYKFDEIFMKKYYAFYTILCFFIKTFLHKILILVNFTCLFFLLNPANIGMFDAAWHFSNNFCQQWNAIEISFHIFSIGFDKTFNVG